MQINVIHDNDTEKNRLLHTLVQTANGFYYNRGFAVLPYLEAGNAATVHLPKLKYQNIINGWAKWANTVEVVPMKYPKDWLQEINQIFSLDPAPLTDLISKDMREIQTLNQEFTSFLSTIFPHWRKTFVSIEIWRTYYGTKMSYDNPWRVEDGKFICTIRKDMPISLFIEATIQMLLHKESANDETWEGREYVADFLINTLEQRGIISQTAPTIEALKNQSQQLLTISNQYLKELGLHFSNKITTQNGIIFISGTPISQHFTPIQNTVLQQLIEKQGNCINYDDLGTLIWDQDEKYSLWAINKTMSRLKEKIEELNFPIKIENKKGEGYYISNLH